MNNFQNAAQDLDKATIDKQAVDNHLALQESSLYGLQVDFVAEKDMTFGMTSYNSVKMFWATLLPILIAVFCFLAIAGMKGLDRETLREDELVQLPKNVN